MKTTMLALAKRYASKLGLWGIVATAIASIFGLETEVVQAWLAPLQGGEELTISGILVMLGTAVHWWMDRQLEDEREAGKKEAEKIDVRGTAVHPDEFFERDETL